MDSIVVVRLHIDIAISNGRRNLISSIGRWGNLDDGLWLIISK
jgi:hypothetical protein